MIDINDILIHLGEDRENYFQAISPPIIQSSNFAFRSVEEIRTAISNEIGHHVYSRGNNPTTAILRKKLAALENTEDALVTSSGASAIAGAVLSCVKAGDHIVCVDKPYSWTNKLVSKFLTRFGVTYDFVDGTDIENIKKAIKENTTLLYLESPNSLTYELQDLSACAQLAKKHGITTIVDNSYCSPIFQKPLDYGIDIVVHSGTKYINGHSDVVIGVICSSSKLIKKIFDSEFMTLGLNLSPHDGALAIRGLRTLELRMKRVHDTATEVVSYLKNHPKIKKVIFPFSPDFPQLELAKKQMSGCGGLFTIELNASSKEEIMRFVNTLSRFQMAVSWGGHESLMLPTLAFHDIPGMENSPIPWTYARFYIGLEDAEYLIDDLEKALESM